MKSTTPPVGHPIPQFRVQDSKSELHGHTQRILQALQKLSKTASSV